MRQAVQSLLLVLMLVPGTAGGQSAPTPQLGAARRVLLAEPMRAPAPRVERLEGRAQGALIGFVVGAGLGAAAGYGVFNGFCEAVDNRCEGSRTLWMAVGGLAVGGVGALVGLLIS